MKRLFLLIAAGIAGLTGANGQMAKGNLFVGSTIGTTTYSLDNYSYNYSSGNNQNQDNKQFILDLFPVLGVFLTDHLVLGGDLDLAYDHQHNNVANTSAATASDQAITNTTTFTLGPFLRYYIYNTTPGANVFYLEGDLGAGSGGGNSADSYNYTNNSSSTYTAHNNSMFVVRTVASIGVTHFLTKTLGLDVSLGYLYDFQQYTSTFATETTSTAGKITNSPGTFKAALGQNGISIAAGFHFFVP